MTAVIALRTKKNVIVGGDSAGVTGYSLTIREDPKVFRVGPFVIGYTSSFRMGQLLRFGHANMSITTLKPGKDALCFMVRKFVPRVRTILTKAGYTEIKNNKESFGTFLVAWGRQICLVDTDLQVGVAADPYVACGCAEDIARGSLYSTSGTPRSRVLTALKAAERHSIGVRGPFVILET